MSTDKVQPVFLEDDLRQIAEGDVMVLKQKHTGYGDSWKRRGGVGAFMMAARKWDRLENIARAFKWDIFDAALADGEADDEGVLDDIGDLRRYLLLIELEVRLAMMDPMAANGLREIQARILAEQAAERQAMAEHAAAIRSQGA